jgi:hypothetical protein
VIREKSISGFVCRYHRNGVWGQGFYACRFRWRDGRVTRTMLATVVPDEPGACHVVWPDDIAMCWLGDDFEPILRRLIEAAGDSPFSHSEPEVNLT